MKEETLLEINKICVNRTSYGDDNLIPPELTFEWIEPSNYCMYPDDEVSIDIEKEDAEKLIAILKLHFNL